MNECLESQSLIIISSHSHYFASFKFQNQIVLIHFTTTNYYTYTTYSQNSISKLHMGILRFYILSTIVSQNSDTNTQVHCTVIGSITSQGRDKKCFFANFLQSDSELHKLSHNYITIAVLPPPI